MTLIGRASRRLARTSFALGRKADARDRPRAATLLYAVAASADRDHVRARRELDKRSSRAPGQRRFVQEIILGTTGQCNASCIHCPTGKISTAHVPRTPMPMAIFEKIVRGVAEQKLAVPGQIGFGLFGDGLLDPFVVEPARMLKAILPDVHLGITTNAAAFNPKRHGALVDYATAFTIHCESLMPPVYDELMAPLRLKNVLPKFRMMLDAFPGKIRVSVPVTTLNRAELPAIREWWLENGARDVIFDPISSRCAEDRREFDRLSIAPVRIACTSQVLDYLVIDSDGLVLACCQDFQRREPVGDLARQSFAEALDSLERRRFADLLDSGAHDSIPTCDKCFGDLREPAAAA